MKSCAESDANNNEILKSFVVLKEEEVLYSLSFKNTKDLRIS